MTYDLSISRYLKHPKANLNARKNKNKIKTMGALRSPEFPCVLQKGTTSRESFAVTKYSHFFKKGTTLSFGCTWGFPKMGVPQNGWFIMDISTKNESKMDDLGTPSSGNFCI